MEGEKKVSYNHFAPGRKHCSPMAFQTSCHSSLIYDVSPQRLSAFRALEKLGCAISKVTESRWAGPDSRCVRASRTINSRREDGQPEPMLRLARLHQFFERASANPTSVSCLMADTAGRRDSVELRMDHLDVRLRNHSRGGVQTVFRTTVKLYTVTHENTHIHAQETHMATQTTHCVRLRPGQYGRLVRAG